MVYNYNRFSLYRKQYSQKILLPYHKLFIAMELDLPRTYHWVFLLVIIVSSAVIFRKKERLPDVEFLRISAKPGKAGNADDVKAFLADSLNAILKGYREVNSQHFILL